MLETLPGWADAARLSAGLPTLQWSLLLALAAAAGHLVQRHAALPKVVGYSVVGALVGLAGFSDVAWPLQGVGLFLLELGVSIVLFEAGGRLALRWFRHNPMVLVQSLLEAGLTYAFVYFTLRWLGVVATVAEALAVVAMVGSPALLSRISLDTRASGPMIERALVLTTLGALYALVLVSARTRVMQLPRDTWLDTVLPIVAVWGLSVALGLVLAAALRLALRVMSPASENTAILLISLIAAGTALAPLVQASAPLAALLAGLFLKHMHPRPWSWPRQLGTAGSLVVMLNFVLVSMVAAQAPWNPAVAGLVLALIGARLLAKLVGVSLANAGSGLDWRKAFWTGCAMSPMSSVALLLVCQFMAASPARGAAIAGVALPAILLMEVLGAIVATYAIYRVGESAQATTTTPGVLRRSEASHV